MPLLVRVLAGNSVTATIILACLNTADARHARRLHPAVAGAVAGVPWADMDTPIVDAIRWRAGLPAAVRARLTPLAGGDSLTSEPAAAALSGITHLDLDVNRYMTDDLLRHLPTSLRSLDVHCCWLTAAASFAHLTALTTLDCSMTFVVSEQTDGLPPSLQELDISWSGVSSVVSLAHLSQLRVLRANSIDLYDATLASLPPSLEELHATLCRELTSAASFAHLTALRKLDVANSIIDCASLATLPPSLVSLNARECYNLTPATTLPYLPALRLLDVSGTGIGDALVASLPPSLIELRLASCRGVSAGASLDHVRALQQLHCIDTQLAPAVIAACRDRGCVVPAAAVLRGHVAFLGTLAVLDGGRRLASGDSSGEVRLWDVAAGGEATAVVRAGDPVHALAALRDSRCLAIGTTSLHHTNGYIEFWNVGGVSPVHRATIGCSSGVWALAALPASDGRLAAGCNDCKVRIVDGDAGAVVATLAGHTARVMALVVLPDGALASGSTDATVRVWDVGELVCVATLTGHISEVYSMAVLADGRLASMTSGDDAVRLWDVGARACVGVLDGRVTALAALPDGRLAIGFEDGTVQLWDTRPAVAATASRAAGAVPVEVVGVLAGGVWELLSLPDGRLACGGGGDIGEDGIVYLVELPPPAACE